MFIKITRKEFGRAQWVNAAHIDTMWDDKNGGACVTLTGEGDGMFQTAESCDEILKLIEGERARIDFLHAKTVSMIVHADRKFDEAEKKLRYADDVLNGRLKNDSGSKY